MCFHDFGWVVAGCTGFHIDCYHTEADCCRNEARCCCIEAGFGVVVDNILYLVDRNFFEANNFSGAHHNYFWVIKA